MKKLDKMYLCYLGNGSNCLYCNPTTGRTEADEVKVILPENVEIVTMVSGIRMVEYHNGYYPGQRPLHGGKQSLHPHLPKRRCRRKTDRKADYGCGNGRRIIVPFWIPTGE